VPVQKPFEGGFWHQLDSLFPWSAEINENLTTENAIDRSPTKAQKFGNLSNAEMFFDLLRGRYHQKRPLPLSLIANSLLSPYTPTLTISAGIRSFWRYKASSAQ